MSDLSLTGFSKDQAKDYFLNKTKEIGLDHTFDFDDAWDFVESKKALSKVSDDVVLSGSLNKLNDLTKSEFRSGIKSIEKKISALGVTREQIDAANPVEHLFADGCYIRRVFNPAGAFIVTKIHKKDHPFFLLRGEMTVFSEKGYEVLKAPYFGITKAGTKRFICAHENCVFVTVHVTDKKTVEEVEKDVICESFEEFDGL